VDDNPVNRRLLESILGRQGYQTTVAADGEQAIAMGLSRDFDLILLDVMMPGKDGYQVCAELKRAQRCAETPIIFVSALAEADDHVKGLELGAADYINKPFNRGEVLARVNTHIQIGTLTRELRRMNSELLARQLLLEQDLAAAREIQASLLPRSRSIAEPWVKIDWCFEPCDSVSGDVFNVFWLDHEHLVPTSSMSAATAYRPRWSRSRCRAVYRRITDGRSSGPLTASPKSPRPAKSCAGLTPNIPWSASASF
jgi:sigma-B regulation protein RsbU (phosphoserine phosphatase)